MELTKIPPHDIEAEQAVLGSMLIDRDAVLSVTEFIKAEDFYRDDNRAIYLSIVNLYAKSEPIDIITVKAQLIEDGMFEKVGGLEYLATLPDKVPTTANVDTYIKIVEEKSLLRQLIKASNELIELGYSQNEDIESIMDQAEKKIFDCMKHKNHRGYFSIKDILVDTFVQIEKMYNQKGILSGVKSGFSDLDRKLSGLNKSDLILIAARPSMGKSALAINIATNVGVYEKVPVLVFSLEMSKEQVGTRILCSESMIDSEKIRSGKMEENDWVKLAGAVGPVSEAPIYVDDTAGISIIEIRSKARKLKLEKNIGLIVIDYLQLIQGVGKKGATREQEISEISRSLKILAKELDVPVIALSQLSRAVEQRGDHRPMLSDLRESGAIEQDADIVMFIYRDDYYNPETEKKGIADLIIAKNRTGAIGSVELLWLPNYTKFANLKR
ncbi:MAG: replicative DNA helicase [Oscillospiraceae bacterium]|nr:replicative DNA helicase [Oscillospiraceae bacterium]